MIEFKNVSKKFHEKTVLSNISFKIPKGEVVVLIGLSGCGKTTTLKIINRLVEPSSGKIFINGQDNSLVDLIKLRRNMGYVIQQTGLFPHMTVQENIELIAKLEKQDQKKIAKRTLEVMEMVGLETDLYLNSYPNQLSGGQQQRVGVARAFAIDPEIILMDEPFSALDPITKSDLQDELIHLQDTLKKTIVFVTHDMTEAIKIADKICIMDQGHIIQYDAPENILKNPVNEFVKDFIGQNRIWESPELIKSKDIMIQQPITGNPNMVLWRCLDRMRSYKVDSLLIIEKTTQKLLGIIRAKVIRNQKNLNLPVKDVMVTDYLSTGPEDSILEVLELVQEKNISNIPVVDENKKLLGLITKSSLVTTLSDQYIDIDENQPSNSNQDANK